MTWIEEENILKNIERKITIFKLIDRNLIMERNFFCLTFDPDRKGVLTCIAKSRKALTYGHFLNK